MTGRIGIAGRRALDLATDLEERRPGGILPHARRPVSGEVLPLLQRTADAGAPASEADSAQSPTPAEASSEATRRETDVPTPREVADRVYHLFCRDLRRDRERRGRG